MNKLQQLQEENREQAELVVFWETITSGLPKSIERYALGDEKIFIAFKRAYPEIRKHVFKLGQLSGIELSEGCIPEEIDKSSHEDNDWTYSYPFNECRTESLTNLSDLKQKI